ncbi:MAG: hypothetical protein QXN55_00345 [Candidatus Nitrosotenuis sp.]
MMATYTTTIGQEEYDFTDRGDLLKAKEYFEDFNGTQEEFEDWMESQNIDFSLSIWVNH